ncbi:MAG: glycosyltransferase family 2 protein [Synergistaceae bacterium]|jgi:glycosyltransferase involved in cell wall biosynthesis|nr:glycosyltransferase family 2 protein [Synergistaceae bacterium]
MKKLSIVIPAFNEEKYIADVLTRVKAADISKNGFEKDIVVVDDGSTDATASKVKSFEGVKLISKPNAGKGSAVQRGIREADGDWILIQDADLEYFPEDYAVLLDALDDGGKVAVYGSRPMGQIKERGWKIPPGKHPSQRFGPWLMNAVLTLEVFLLYGKWITDNLTAYKLYPAQILKRHNFVTTGFEGDHEITALLIRSGIAIKEVPIRYSPRGVKEGKKIRVRDGFTALWTLLRYRFIRWK